MKYRIFPGTDLDFLTTQMTLGQAALKWFAAASDKPDLGREQMASVAELAAVNFGVDEDPMSYKGTMARVAS
jgi:hypothetical protein